MIPGCGASQEHGEWLFDAPTRSAKETHPSIWSQALSSANQSGAAKVSEAAPVRFSAAAEENLWLDFTGVRCSSVGRFPEELERGRP